MKSPLYILIGGKAGCGKSTAALILQDHLVGWPVTIRHLASPVKEAARGYFGWDGEKDERGRELLQRIGQVGRAYNEDLWVSQMLSEIRDIPSIVLVDDFRFPNEANYIRKHTPWVVTIQVAAPSREILKGLPAYNEISETANDEFEFDYIVNNEGSMDGLAVRLRPIIDKEVEAWQRE